MKVITRGFKLILIISLTLIIAIFSALPKEVSDTKNQGKENIKYKIIIKKP